MSEEVINRVRGAEFLKVKYVGMMIIDDLSTKLI